MYILNLEIIVELQQMHIQLFEILLLMSYHYLFKFIIIGDTGK